MSVTTEIRDEALVHKSRIAVPYTWSAGTAGTRFLKTLKEEHRFLASRCNDCRRLSLPPTKACGGCLGACSGWVEVGPRGVLLSYASPGYASPVHPVPWPVYGLVRLDGADAGLLVLLHGVQARELRTGMRVEPVFLASPSWALHDIVRFRPAGES